MMDALLHHKPAVDARLMNVTETELPTILFALGPWHNMVSRHNMVSMHGVCMMQH